MVSPCRGMYHSLSVYSSVSEHLGCFHHWLLCVMLVQMVVYRVIFRNYKPILVTPHLPKALQNLVLRIKPVIHQAPYIPTCSFLPLRLPSPGSSHNSLCPVHNTLAHPHVSLCTCSSLCLEYFYPHPEEDRLLLPIQVSAETSP